VRSYCVINTDSLWPLCVRLRPVPVGACVRSVKRRKTCILHNTQTTSIGLRISTIIVHLRSWFRDYKKGFRTQKTLSIYINLFTVSRRGYWVRTLSCCWISLGRWQRVIVRFILRHLRNRWICLTSNWWELNLCWKSIFMKKVNRNLSFQDCLVMMIDHNDSSWISLLKNIPKFSKLEQLLSLLELKLLRLKPIKLHIRLLLRSRSNLMI
jgi:hypothetical protein